MTTTRNPLNHAPMLPTNDMRIEVDVTAASGAPDRLGGVAFRLLPTNEFYDFVVRPTGEFGLGKNKAGKFTAIVDYTMHPAVKKGIGQTNHLRVDAVGDTITAYVNGQQVHQFKDPDFKLGIVALEAGSGKNNAEAVIHFDNLVITRP